MSDRPVRTPVIEIVDILGQDPAQVAFIEDEHVIQTLGSGRSHPPLGNRVRLGCFERCTDLPDAEPLEPPIEYRSVTAVSVMDEKPRRSMVPPTGFYDLLQDLGHASIKTTELYLDFLTPAEQRQAKFGSAQNPAQL